MVYIAVKIPWIRWLSQYLEGQWNYPSQIYSHLVVPHPVLYLAPGSLPLVWRDVFIVKTEVLSD